MVNIYALLIAFIVGIAMYLFVNGILVIRRIAKADVSKFKAQSAHIYTETNVQYEQKNTKNKVPIKTNVVLFLLGSIVIGTIAFIVTGVIWIAAASMLGGFYIPNIWYKWYVESNKNMMLKQMEQACEVIAINLKTGVSLPEAFEKAAKETENPLKIELHKTATQIRVGVLTSVAFEEFVKNTGVDELSIVSMAIEFQEKGMAVNLANLFLQIQSDIRHKIQFKKEVSAATTENKMSGIIIAAVPFVSLTAMRLFSPEFVEPLLTTPLGLVIFAVCCIIIFVGMKWMFSIANLVADS